MDNGEGAAARNELDNLQREYWEWQLREYPELSTWTGDNRYGDRFTDLSWNAIEKRWADERMMLNKVRQIDTSKLTGQDVLSHALLAWDLDLSVRAQSFPPVMLLTHITGPQLVFPQLVSVSPFRTSHDYHSYLARLATFPRYLDQVTDLLHRGISTGWVQPAEALHRVPGQIEGQIAVKPQESNFYSPFKQMPEGISGKECSAFRSDGLSLIEKSVFPALKKFHDFVLNTYLPAGLRPVSAGSLPDGPAYYSHCIREYTTTDLGAEEIHQIGIEEVSRIRKRMEEVIGQTGFVGSLEQFSSSLRSDPRFYFLKGEDLVAAYRDIAKRADAELPTLFAELPRTPYGVRAFPDFEAPGQATAMYYPGASDGSRAGYFMVNTYRLDMRPKYEMEALTLHEAVPGHHLQISRAQELKDLPDFRRNASYTAYIEGWALYAESLGTSMGFYTDPYSRFGQLIYEMWRACRLVVDTGIHAFGWSRKQAIEYMREHTAKTEQDIAVEVDRYIVWPGQALAYKIGELEIRRQREAAERELKAAFDLRTFHNAVLDNGPLPLMLLREQMSRWIQIRKTA